MEAGWRNFEYTLYDQELPKLSVIHGGYNYRIPPAGAIIESGKLLILPPNAALSVRYTNNGEDPDKSSPVYKEPLEPASGIRVKVFDKTGKTSRVTIIHP